MTDNELIEIVEAAFQADKPRQQEAAAEITARVSQPKVDSFLVEKERAAKEGRLL